MSIINTGDFVVDVGGIYNSKKNLFDHHQKEGAGKRKNGIPYASFGLVWKRFGKELCGSQFVSDKIDQILAQSIDAGDNGIDYVKLLYKNVWPYEPHSLFAIFQPTWKENQSTNKSFWKMLSWAREILTREIKVNSDFYNMKKITDNEYRKSENKKIIVVNKSFSRFDLLNVLGEYSEPLYVIYPDKEDKNWKIAAIKKTPDSFKSRKPLPKNWAGMQGIEFQKITNVNDAIFCHRALFLASAKSKDGALKLAKIALKA